MKIDEKFAAVTQQQATTGITYPEYPADVSQHIAKQDLEAIARMGKKREGYTPRQP